jgi:hypothetical protein
MRFINMTNNKELTTAAYIASELLHPSSPLIRKISTINDFRYNSGNGSEIVMKLCAPRPQLPIYTYKSKNPFSRAIGYFDGKAIHLNTRKLPLMEHQDLVANLLHEWSHYCGFGHGNNYKTKEKMEFSVPYWISENVYKWINWRTPGVSA